MTTTNGHIRDRKDGDVYCGRGKGLKVDPTKCSSSDDGYFGNPVAVGRKCCLCNKTHINGGSTLPCYEEYLKARLLIDQVFKTTFYKLKGKHLLCFCKPFFACHTDIMIKYLDGVPNKDVHSTEPKV